MGQPVKGSGRGVLGIFVDYRFCISALVPLVPEDLI